jgi:predicted deacetylase
MKPPLFGISLIMSVVIILTHKLWLAVPNVAQEYVASVFSHKAIKQTIAPLILVGMILLVGGLYSSFLRTAILENHNNLQVLQNRTIACEELTVTTSERMTVLRLDDVQAYGWTDISIKMMEATVASQKPIVAGVIPYNLSTDNRIEQYFMQHGCNTEIALHGYDHGITGAAYEISEVTGEGEFGKLTATEARERIEKAFLELDFLSSHNKITTFIPPHNVLSQEVVPVLNDFGMTIISSEGDGQYDYDATSWNYQTNEYVSAETILNNCETSFSTGDNVCVIMLHPQNFANEDTSLNEPRYQDYLFLLDELDKRNITVVRFSDILATPDTEGVVMTQ